MTTKVNTAPRLAGPLAFAIAVAAMAMPHAQGNQSRAPGVSADGLVQLSRDVHQLKVEVLQMRIDIEQGRLEMLERELRTVEEHLRSLTSEEQSLQQEVEGLQHQQHDAALSAEQREQATVMAWDVLTNGSAWLSEERATVEQKQSAIQALLSQTYKQRAELLARAADLGIPANGQAAH